VPKASEVAAELRKLAESLEQEPDTEIQPVVIRSYHVSEAQKEHFLNLARLLPRPYRKEYEGGKLQLSYGTDWRTPISVTAQIERSLVCHLVRPAQEAVYECEPLLSEAEEAQIGGAA